MKKFLSLFVISFLLINTACTQVKQNQVLPLENSLLWEISGNGLKSSSYLFGTNHLLGKNFTDSVTGINERFKTCKAVAGEIVIDTASLHKINPIWFLKNNSIRKILTPEEFATTAKYVKQYAHTDLISLDKTRPAFIEIFLLLAIAPKTASSTNPSLDQYFQDEGKNRGYKIIGLETEEFQNSLIFDVPVDAQKRHLNCVISNFELARENIYAANKFYRQQDLNALERLIQTDKEYTQDERDAMRKNRNLKWMGELPEIMKDQPTFIVVGCAHLPGEYGLINQLRLNGYIVKPVKIRPTAPIGGT